MAKQAFVYMMTNLDDRVIYTGVTTKLKARIWQHRNKSGGRLTAAYKATKLIYFEVFDDPYNAIVREKQIKSGKRANKVALIESMNPEWKDLWEEI
jgi:putative endonuclease